MPNSTILEPAARNRDALRGCGRSSRISEIEWRCTRCSKLLGVFRDRQLHLRFARGHEYLVALPATCTCRGCGTLNRTSDPAN